jgi:hypothetical protein
MAQEKNGNEMILPSSNSDTHDVSMLTSLAYLRNMLVDRVGQVRDAINVGPGKGVRKCGLLHVSVRQRRLKFAVVNGILADLE